MKTSGTERVKAILESAGRPIEGHRLSFAQMEAAIAEGRVLEVYSWSNFGDSQSSFGPATRFGVDARGRIASGYLVFPRPIPIHLREAGPPDWEKASEVIEAFVRGEDSGFVSRDTLEQADRVRSCSICSELSDFQRGFQKATRESDNTYLPEAAEQLEVTANLKPESIRLPGPEDGKPPYLDIPSSRLLQLKRCPKCSTYFLYRTDYEFLPLFGTEDEQELTRLTDSQAAALERPSEEGDLR